MISKPSRLGLSGMALVCAAFLAACNNSSPRVQFVTVAPNSGEIYVSGKPAGGVRGAASQGARPDLLPPGTTGKRPAVTIPPVTAACGSLQYAATALFSDGSTKDVSKTATWTSSSSSVATINSSGLATGVGLGTTNIGASFSGVAATSEPLAVDQLNSITLNPATANIAVGASQSFLAIGNFTFAAGGSGNLDVSSQVTWNSSNTAVATIDNTGKATAVATGSTTITATSCDGIMIGKATLTVGPPSATSLVIMPATITISTGTTTLFTAMEKLSNGMTQPLAHPVTWSSGTTTVATIDANSAVALGITAGTSTITATESVSNLTGTATLTVQAAAARFAYIANVQGNGSGTALGSGTISGYTANAATGALTPLTGSPFAASSPQQVLIHPSGRLMYYPNVASDLQTAFIDPVAGGVTLSGRAPSKSGSGGTNVGVIDPLGRFIYIIDAGSTTPTIVAPTIYGFSIAQTQTQSTNGVLTAIPGLTAYTDATLSSPSWVMTDRAGKYLYVVNSGGNSVSEYGITQTGASAGALTLLSTTPIPTGSAPIFGTTDVNGHLFVANSGDNTVSVFSIGSTGLLTQVGSNFTVTGATTVVNVLTDPTGKYLYVLDSPGPTATTTPPGQVFAFSLNTSTGAIGSQIGTPHATGASPIGMAIDPTGALLAIDNNVDYTISLYTVSTSTGALTPASPATAKTDSIPQFVTFYTAASDQ